VLLRQLYRRSLCAVLVQSTSRYTDPSPVEFLWTPFSISPPPTRKSNPNSPTMPGALESFSKWVQLKIYQLEVTYSVYMFTPMEKFIFCTYLSLSLLPCPFTDKTSPLNGARPIFRDMFPLTKTLRSGSYRLLPLPPLRPHLHRLHPLPAPSHPVHHQPRLVLHTRRGRLRVCQGHPGPAAQLDHHRGGQGDGGCGAGALRGGFLLPTGSEGMC
jgi:hypothetical protein